MRFTACKILVASTCLMLFGCNSHGRKMPVIYIGNADIEDQKSVVEDFEYSFASEVTCHGIRIETHRIPEGEYWFLETYSADRAEIYEPGDGINWWMMHNNIKHELIFRYDGDDKSSMAAAKHVCLIINGKGGEID